MKVLLPLFCVFAFAFAVRHPKIHKHAMKVKFHQALFPMRRHNSDFDSLRVGPVMKGGYGKPDVITLYDPQVLREKMRLPFEPGYPPKNFRPRFPVRPYWQPMPLVRLPPMMYAAPRNHRYVGPPMKSLFQFFPFRAPMKRSFTRGAAPRKHSYVPALAHGVHAKAKKHAFAPAHGLHAKAKKLTYAPAHGLLAKAKKLTYVPAQGLHAKAKKHAYAPAHGLLAKAKKHAYAPAHGLHAKAKKHAYALTHGLLAKAKMHAYKKQKSYVAAAYAGPHKKVSYIAKIKAPKNLKGKPAHAHKLHKHAKKSHGKHTTKHYLAKKLVSKPKLVFKPAKDGKYHPSRISKAHQDSYELSRQKLRRISKSFY